MPQPTVCGMVLLLLPSLSLAGVGEGFGDLNVLRGAEAFEAGEPADALALLKPIAEGPDRGELTTDARFHAARAALALGDSDATIRYLHGLDSRLPELTDYVWDLRARAHRDQGDWERARQLWRHLLTEYAQSPLADDARYSMADADWSAGRIEEAREGYELALANASRSDRASLAKFTLARIAEQESRFEDAAKIYRYFAYRLPSHPVSPIAEGHLGRLVDAELVEPPNFYTRLGRVDRLLKRRSIEEAEANLNVLEAEATTWGRRNAISVRRAEVFYRQRKYDEAIAAFAKLGRRTTSEPKQLEYKYWVARCHSAAGNPNAAIELYLEIAEAYEGEQQAREALFKAAWLAYNGSDHKRAIKLFGNFIALYPSDSGTADALWFLGWNAYRLGDLPTAARSFQRLRLRFPSSSLKQRAYYWEGRIAAQMGNRDAAIESYTSTLEGRPFTYYTALASQRLAELRDDAETSEQPILFASLEDPDRSGSDALQPGRDELPEYGGLEPLPQHRLPWGAAVFDWTTFEGRRVLRLMRLGMRHEASKVLSRMDALEGHEDSDIAYARARLMYGLGDYNRAYRIVLSTFRDELKSEPDGVAYRYWGLAYPDAFGDLVRESAAEFDMSPLLILSVMRQESAFNDRARSWASAKGLMQIIPRTGSRIASALEMDAYDYGVLSDPEVNVRFGAWYLSQLITKFRGNFVLAIGSYNAGPIAVSKWVDQRKDSNTDEFVEDIPYRETRHYVKRVLGNLAAYHELYRGAPVQVPVDIPDTYLDNVDF